MPWTLSTNSGRLGSLVPIVAPLENSPIASLVFHSSSISVDSPGLTTSRLPSPLSLGMVQVQVEPSSQISRSPSPVFLTFHFRVLVLWVESSPNS